MESSVKPQGRVKQGSLRAEVGKASPTDEEFAAFESTRD
ncbi:hypothetical protein VO64_1921 [Pseudomonas synxantha]|uniref:Uncharacterized protein n=1 Tax=Pseudomonas synxantha TaxID=47883 RepID=A0AAU8TWN9_9PSED|nr:hypothetical protein VO64_1921 [Pseudomonas synxantha]